MKKSHQVMTSLVATLCVGLAGVSQANDQDNRQSRSEDGTLMAQAGTTYGRDQQRGANPQARDLQTGRESIGQPKAFNKASKLIGMQVKNEQGETLGDIKDVVIDIEKGSVSYVVLSAGGVLGVGDKLLAVPLTAFKQTPTTIEGDDKDTHLVLQADKNSISRAEGIGENWPSVQNPTFGATPFWQNQGEDPTRPGTQPPGMRRGPRDTNSPGQFNR